MSESEISYSGTGFSMSDNKLIIIRLPVFFVKKHVVFEGFKVIFFER